MYQYDKYNITPITPILGILKLGSERNGGSFGKSN